MVEQNTMEVPMTVFFCKILF